MGIEKTIHFSKRLIGSKYVWWLDGPLSDGPPNWSSNSKVPPIEVVKRLGTNCTGLTNLMLRFSLKNIPSHPENSDWDGGIEAYYFTYFDKFVKFSDSISWPKGTLLFRRYRNLKDQGHVAVVIENNKLIQSYHPVGVDDSVDISDSHFGYYYELALLPENWII